MADAPLDRDGWFKIEISTDCMEAYLVFEPPTGAGKWPSKDKAVESLRSEGVINYDQTALDEAITNHTLRTLIAKGKSPQSGIDAEIQIFFETGVFRKASIEDSAGKVDFRNIQTIQSVHSGDVIAEKTPATAGEDGIDVRGRKISPTPGKDKPLVLGKNVAWGPDNQKVVATGGGEPLFLNHRISVLPVHEIKGSVNFESGNINFPGNLVVRGNVESGFKVEAEGDVSIYGSVDSAEVRAGGNLYIQGGVSGMDKSELYSGGDLSAKYIERTKVFCQGNLTVREAIMHCIVNVDQKITVEGGKGLIVGGLIRSGGEITAKMIGSRLGTVTELEVGVKPQIKQELQEVEARLKVNIESLDKAEKAIVLLNKIPNLPPDRKAMVENLIKTSYALKAANSDDEAKRQGMIEEIVIKSKERGRVKVSDTIYPGVRVTIGKTTLPIQDEIKYTIVYYNEGEIHFQAFR